MKNKVLFLSILILTIFLFGLEFSFARGEKMEQQPFQDAENIFFKTIESLVTLNNVKDTTDILGGGFKLEEYPKGSKYYTKGKSSIFHSIVINFGEQESEFIDDIHLTLKEEININLDRAFEVFKNGVIVHTFPPSNVIKMVRFDANDNTSLFFTAGAKDNRIDEVSISKRYIKPITAQTENDFFALIEKLIDTSNVEKIKNILGGDFESGEHPSGWKTLEKSNYSIFSSVEIDYGEMNPKKVNSVSLRLKRNIDIDFAKANKLYAKYQTEKAIRNPDDIREPVAFMVKGNRVTFYLESGKRINEVSIAKNPGPLDLIYFLKKKSNEK